MRIYHQRNLTIAVTTSRTQNQRILLIYIRIQAIQLLEIKKRLNNNNTHLKRRKLQKRQRKRIKKVKLKQRKRKSPCLPLRKEKMTKVLASQKRLERKQQRRRPQINSQQKA